MNFLYVCSVLGAVLIVVGLYSVLWGKHKENSEIKDQEEIPDAIKVGQVNGNGALAIEDIEANEIQMGKGSAAEANDKVLFCCH